MKQLRSQQHSHHHHSKAWASLDCLLTSLPITPLSRSSIIMRSNGNLPMTDTRRISPQTTSSSGYHSDLSSATSANESPQSIHEILPISVDKSSTSQIQKKTVLVTNNSMYDKSLSTKNLSRISSFLRKQYERAKSKFSAKSLSSSQTSATTVLTCSKATSTTPLSHLSEENYTLSTKEQQQQQQNSLSNQKSHCHQHYLSSVYKENSFIEPVYSVYVHPLHQSNQVKITPSHSQKNYASIHECYSQQPAYRYSAIHNTHQYPSSYRRLATMANLQNHNYNVRRHHYYPVETSSSCQTTYSSHYPPNHSDFNRSNYVPLSDFMSTGNSAFKPIKQKQFYQHPVCNNLYEQIPPSTDPCDLEVAQYFPHTSQWSNPNYFDIYSKDNHIIKANYTETLC